MKRASNPWKNGGALSDSLDADGGVGGLALTPMFSTTTTIASAISVMF